MKKAFLIGGLVLASSALAQQTSPTFSAVTVDGTTFQNGLVTINGRTYVSTDALSKSKVTVLGPSSFGVYTFPTGQRVTTKLTGCINEWVTDGINRIRVTDQELNSGSWVAHIEMQTSLESVELDKTIQFDKVYLLFKNGRVFDPTTNQFQKSSATIPMVSKGGVTGGAIVLDDADFTEDNTGVKMVLRPVKGSPWTFDLTCEK